MEVQRVPLKTREWKIEWLLIPPNCYVAYPHGILLSLSSQVNFPPPNFRFYPPSTQLPLLSTLPRVPMISSSSFQCLWFPRLRKMLVFSGTFSITEASSPTEAGPDRTGIGTAGRDHFIFRLSSSATVCHGFWHDASLLLPSVLFVLYLGFHARSNIKKLSHRRSFVMIGYYGLLWFAVLLNLAWCFLQVLIIFHSISLTVFVSMLYYNITLDNSFTS